jgi:hypothetical protein
MLRSLQSIDDVLRGRSAIGLWGSPGVLLVVCGLCYGGIMGSYGIEHELRFRQICYSAIKTPLLLLATFALSLPSFFVLNTLAGLRADFGDVVKALIASQAVVTIVLAALCPFTALWYVSNSGYSAAILFNACMFAIASFAGQGRLRQNYRVLIARNGRHRVLFWFWLTDYVFVGIQMGWTLRPFIGDPHSPVQFFRDSEMESAYVVVFRMVTRGRW